MGEDGKIVYKVVIDDKGVQTEAEQAGQRAGDSFGKGAGTMEQVWTGAARRIGEAFTNMAINAAKAAGKLLTGSIQIGMDFDAAMSQVAATLGYTTEQLNDATTQQAQDFQALRDFALEMGKTTAFTAQQSAEALNYMALAGYDAETSMRMLPTVLNLAAAGGMDLARASDAVTDIQSAFGLTIEDTVKLVDQMAKTAQKTNTSVSQLSEAMLTVGGAASYMRGGTAEVAEVLGIMASAGIKGAEGGTHLRNMLLRLAAPTEKGAQALEDVGVAIFDAEGKMRSFSEIMPELSKALDGMTDEEKLNFFDTVFNVRDIAAVNALLGISAERWNSLGNEIRNSEGAAQDMADVQLDNLKGDLTLLKSAREGFKIELADKFAPILRQIMPQLLELIGRLTERLQNADWSNLGDQILTIADKLMQLIGYIIDNADKIGNVFSTIGGALLLGKGAGAAKSAWDTVSGLFGGAKAATGAAAAAAPAAQAAGPAVGETVGAAAAPAFWSTVLAASPLAAVVGGIGIGWKLGSDQVNEAKAMGTIDEGSIAEYEQLLDDLAAERARVQADFDNLALYGGDLTMASNELARIDTAILTAQENLAALQAQAAELEGSGEDAMASYADGITIGADKWLIPALATAAGLFSAYFHHSEPDVGPMADDADWMPDMMAGWARQIRDYAPELSGALSFALPTRADFERSVSVNIAARGSIGARAIENTIVLNGREIARATAWDMGEQLAWEEL